MPIRTPDASQVSALARLFSPGVVRDFAARGRSALFSRLIVEAGLSDRVVDRMTVGDAYEVAFKVIAERRNRHEYVYKSALAERVLLGKHSLKTARMLTEFRVGDCKADVVILNGTSVVYEIKSERDSLVRLPHQLDTYMRAFDHVYVITGANHLSAVAEIAPPSVGILVLSDRFHISTIRDAGSNRRHIDPLLVFDSLQRGEAKEILAACGIEVPDMPNTLIHGVMREAFGRIPPDDLHLAFVATLKRYRQQRGLDEFLAEVPRSLRAAVLSFPMRAKERERFGAALRAPFDEARGWAKA